MAFNINTFKADGLRFGGVRGAYFEVQIFSPLNLGSAGAIGANISTASDRTRFLIQAATLPGVSVGKIPVPYFGRKINLVGDKEFADWQVTVMNDEDFALRAMFEKWSNDMNAAISNRMAPEMLYTAYKSTAEVYQYGKDKTIIRAYRLEGLFPTDISDIDLDWDDTNNIERFRVTFAYDLWVPIVQGANDTYNGIIAPDATSS